MRISPQATLGATCAAALLFAAGTAGADAVADFYRSRTVSVVVGFSPGGGGDTFGRLLARHIGAHIPGKPNVIVQNMPGAGGFTAISHVYNAAAKDGSILVLTNSSSITAPSMGHRNARWDIFRFQWLGNLTRDAAGCVASARSGLGTITTAAERQIIFGATGSSSPSAQQPRLLAHLFGYRMKVIAGYKGTADVRLAMEKGEVDAVCAFWASLAVGPQKADMQSGKLVPILQMGSRKHPAFGDAPLAYDLARNEEERQIMRFIYGPTEISRPFAVPPGVPAERVAALRQAFWAAANAPGLKDDAGRQRLFIDPMTWEETVAAFRAVLDVPQPVIDRAKEAIRR
jgi:tripartite-type tricarboxylate transporter receptor subunit TctC